MAGVSILQLNDPHGAKVELPLLARKSLLDTLLAGGIALAHECGGKLACATCRVIVRQGLEGLDPAGNDEFDMLDTAGVLEPSARLACQAIAVGGDLVIEIPQIEARPAAAPADGGALPVRLTARAAEHLAAQLAKRPASAAVRLGVSPAGCSGLRYRVDFADTIREDDVVFESDGIRIAVESASLPHVQGTTLDLVQEGLARRLRFDNPNARSTCGCGESFATLNGRCRVDHRREAGPGAGGHVPGQRCVLPGAGSGSGAREPRTDSSQEVRTVRRPTFLNLARLRFPVGAVASIGHRISGLMLVCALPFSLLALERSLAGEDAFASLLEGFRSTAGRVALVAVAWASAHHLLAGIRHLLMDVGIGSTLVAARASAFSTIIGAALVAVLAMLA